jgi:hypothetical protein
MPSLSSRGRCRESPSTRQGASLLVTFWSAERGSRMTTWELPLRDLDEIGY